MYPLKCQLSLVIISVLDRKIYPGRQSWEDYKLFLKLPWFITSRKSIYFCNEKHVIKKTMINNNMYTVMAFTLFYIY